MDGATRATVKAAMAEYNRGDVEFLEKYSSGFGPKKLYLRHEGKLYPLKSLWAASCRPAIHSGQFNPDKAFSGFKALGLADFVNTDHEPEAISLEHEALEGGRRLKEVNVIKRNPQLVQKAKAHYRYVCVGCGFDFEKFYGVIGHAYIECHHIDELSGRDGKDEPTTIGELVMLCSNCHRMVHRTRPCLTVAELQAKISGAKSGFADDDGTSK